MTGVFRTNDSPSAPAITLSSSPSSLLLDPSLSSSSSPSPHPGIAEREGRGGKPFPFPGAFPAGGGKFGTAFPLPLLLLAMPPLRLIGCATIAGALPLEAPFPPARS